MARRADENRDGLAAAVDGLVLHRALRSGLTAANAGTVLGRLVLTSAEQRATRRSARAPAGQFSRGDVHGEHHETRSAGTGSAFSSAAQAVGRLPRGTGRQTVSLIVALPLDLADGVLDQEAGTALVCSFDAVLGTAGTLPAVHR